MKKVLSVFLIMAVVCTISIPSFAEEPNNLQEGTLLSVTIEELPDGYTLVTELRLISQTRGTVTGSKTVQVKDNNNTVVAKLILTASFTYTPGVSSSCTSASETHPVTGSGWSCSSSSASKSGATASATGTFVKKVLFITVDTRTVNASLYCDTYGIIY